MLLGIYRPPATTGEGYYLQLEEELNSLCTWAPMVKNVFFVTGDLNLDRLRPDKDVYNLVCLTHKPTRVTDKSLTLIDVMLANKPELFESSGVLDPGLRNHAMIYGIIKKSSNQSSYF